MNRAKNFIKKIEEQRELSAANCAFYKEEENVCETGAIRAMVNPGGLCSFISRYDSHQTSCPHYVPENGVSDRRSHV